MTLSMSQRQALTAISRAARVDACASITPADLVAPGIYGITPNDTVGRQIRRAIRKLFKWKSHHEGEIE